MDRVAARHLGGIQQLRGLISEHSLPFEADLIRAGVRLRWVGDGTGRCTIRDLWALANAFAGDERSALHRSLTSGRLPAEQRLAADQVNATLLLEHTMRTAWSDKRQPKWEPLYRYPGSPFSTSSRKVKPIDPAARLGGYRRMGREEAIRWARGRGLRI